MRLAATPAPAVAPLEELPPRARTVGLGFALALVLSVAIFAVCLLIAGVCLVLVLCGVLPSDFYTHPAAGFACILIVSVVLAGVVSAGVNATLVQPLCAMTDAMGELARGNFDHRMQPKGRLELAEVRAFARSFNKAAEELAGTELMRSSFIGDFSHEFRTPITALNGFAQLLRDPGLSAEERAEYVDVIVEESARLATLSERILALSRVEALAILPNVEPVNLAEQIRRCVLLLQPKWERKGVRVSVDLDECSVAGNAAYLAEVWTNLLDNAIKFSPEGSTVSVGLYGGRSDVDGRDTTRDQVVCWISDCGPGMDETTRARLFDKFYQGDTSHAAEGNGLGLALCKRIVELHGGSIAAEGAPGKGSVFEVRLPLAR